VCELKRSKIPRRGFVLKRKPVLKEKLFVLSFLHIFHFLFSVLILCNLVVS
jgi:hypothetical protein